MEITIGCNIFIDTMDKIHQVGNGVDCCGGKPTLLYHVDGTNFYENHYKCECGNQVTVRVKRQKW